MDSGWLLKTFKSLGDGRFQLISTRAGSNYSGSLGDWNGDGKLDYLFVPLETPALGEFWVGNGDGTFKGAVGGESERAEQELYNVFGFLHTEERIIPGATVADIDTDAFRAFLSRFCLELTEAPQPDLLEDLRNRGVIDDDAGVPRPTLYGLPCFGRPRHS